MNAGLSNLDTLKKHLLPASLAPESRFDLVIQDIGQGVAGLMENYCDRKFARVVADQVVLMADRASFSLPRYPVEIISQVELKYRDSDAFQVQDISLIESTSPMAGIVYLQDNTDAGPYWAQVRFTYTGGYWFEQLEPDDDNYPTGAAPAGSTLLPSEIKFAWLTQCREVWNKFDKLGTGLIDKPDSQTKTGNLDLSPMVKDLLKSFRRMQLV